MYSSGKITVFLTKDNTYKLTTLYGECIKELIITSGCVMQTNPQLSFNPSGEKQDTRCTNFDTTNIQTRYNLLRYNFLHVISSRGKYSVVTG